MKERRRYPRMDLDAKVAFRLSDNPAKGSKAVSRNISAEGFCFISGEKLPNGAILEIEIYARGDENPIHVRGSVMWCNKTEGSESYNVGVKVLDVNKIDEGRFLTLYCSRLIERLGGIKDDQKQEHRK